VRYRCATSAWSLPPVPTRAPRPYQGHGDADPKGIAGRTGLEPVSLIRVQSPAAPADRATGHREPFPSADLGGPPLQEAGGRRSKGHCVRPPGLEPGLPSRELAPRASASAYSATSAWSRHPVPTRIIRRTKTEPQAVRGGKAAPRGFEPRFAASEAAVLPFKRKGIVYGRRESNAQAARFGLARSARLPSLPRAPPGS
jgi:hypothetical protein